MTKAVTEGSNKPQASTHNVELSEKHINRILEAHSALINLVPFDTSIKVERAAPWWQVLYEVLAFTSVDSSTESFILNDGRILSIRDSLRRVFGDCEIALEEEWADRIEASATIVEAQEVLKSFPVLPYFHFVAPLELSVASTILSHVPRKVALLGSGPLPLTATFLMDRAKEAGKQVSVLCVDWIEARIQQSERVCRKLGDYPGIQFEVTDIHSGPKDLTEFDVIYCVALVGSTQQEKQALFLSVANRMREGAIMISRSTFSLKTLAYPALNIFELELPPWVQPVTTVKSHGVPGVSLNAALVFSRVGAKNAARGSSHALAELPIKSGRHHESLRFVFRKTISSGESTRFYFDTHGEDTYWQQHDAELRCLGADGPALIP